jgi:pimeloyl-ACP methyl ester carboxylesterase
MKRRSAVLGGAAAALAAAALFWPERPAGPTGAWLSAAGLVPRYESIDGLRVRYVRAGVGPSVLLVHGLGSSIYTWKDTLPSLVREHDVVALDLPGFGRSEIPPGLSAEIYSRTVTGLLDRLGVARASLVGHSLGGAVAVLVAASQPERVDRLVLLDAAGFHLAPAERPWLLRLLASDAGGVLARLPRKRLFVTLALHQVFHDGRNVTDERIDEYLAPAERPGAVEALRLLLAPRGVAALTPFEDVAKRVRASTLVVWGREDAWMPLADAERLAAAIPRARSVVLDACGHMPQEELPAETSRLVSGFLDVAGPR